jgi:isopenicillin N synthase-like dioxygenase
MRHGLAQENITSVSEAVYRASSTSFTAFPRAYQMPDTLDPGRLPTTQVWPVTLGGEADAAVLFRDRLEEYYQHMQRIGIALYAATACGFGLPPTHFQG